MKAISPKIRKQIDSLPFYKVCAKACVKGHECNGRITMEHTIIFAGSQLDALWAIIPLCEFAHSVNTHQDGGDLNKEINLWIALNRAEMRDLILISKAVNYVKELDRLNKKYGSWSEDMAMSAYKPAEKKDDVVLWFPLSKDLKYMVDLIQRNESLYIGLKQSPFDIITKAIKEYHDKVAEEVKTHA